SNREEKARRYCRDLAWRLSPERKTFMTECLVCEGTGWVCENHHEAVRTPVSVAALERPARSAIHRARTSHRDFPGVNLGMTSFEATSHAKERRGCKDQLKRGTRWEVIRVFGRHLLRCTCQLMTSIARLFEITPQSRSQKSVMFSVRQGRVGTKRAGTR